MVKDQYYLKAGKLFYKNREVPLLTLCDFLNYTEKKCILEVEEPIKECVDVETRKTNHLIKFSNWLDYNKYECEYCHKDEIGHNGIWNKDPLLFFCSTNHYLNWQHEEKAKNNELDYCPFCTENKMLYDGRADSYYCYGCHNWYDVDMIYPEYDG